MTMPTIAEVCDAIDAQLTSATGLTRSQSYSELTEGIPDLPLLQVYPNEGGPDLQSYNSFRVERMVIYADLYANQRGPNIGQEMAKMATMTDAILTLLRQQAPQSAGTVFGIASVIKFEWSWQRALFETSQNKYLGTRFILTLWVKG